ncbi:MAG: TonB-dependent receptor, partial [Chryseobacterium sp.]
GIPGLVPSSLYNPEFVWESTKKLELGLELAFLNSRLQFEISLYRNRSSNQLVSYNMPYTTGFPSILSNFKATVQNRGLEALLRADLVTNKNWRWNVSFNLSVPRNKLVRFDGIESSSYVNLFKVGAPLSIQRLYGWAGVDPQTGLHTFIDENYDGLISDLDKKLMNPIDVKYYGGMNNTIQYKSFELSMQFQASHRPGLRFLNGSMPGSSGNQAINVIDRWFLPNDQTDVQRFVSIGYPSSAYGQEAFIAYRNAFDSNYNMQNIFFIRLKSLSCSYSLVPKWTKLLKLQEAKLFIQGQNFMTITGYKGLDPETGYGLPPLRMLTAGIQIRL